MTEIQHPQFRTLTCAFPEADSHSPKCYTGSVEVDALVEKVKAEQAKENRTAVQVLNHAVGMSYEAMWTVDAKLNKAKDEVAAIQQDLGFLDQARELYSKQLEVESAAEKERVLQESRLAAQERREAAAYERLKKQLESKTIQEIAALLVERGLERLEDDPINALEVLRQSGDIIAATYWITGAEFQGSYANEDRDILENRLNTDGVTKRIIVPVSGGGYRAVTGVCSIGALALARTAMANENPDDKVKGLLQYGSLAAFDNPTRLAGFALSSAIIAEEKQIFGSHEDDNIAAWNDRLSERFGQDRARALVLKVFKAAEQSPILNATEAWKFSGVPYYFASKEAALAARTDQQHEAFPTLDGYYENLGVAEPSMVWGADQDIEVDVDPEDEDDDED